MVGVTTAARGAGGVEFGALAGRALLGRLDIQEISINRPGALAEARQLVFQCERWKLGCDFVHRVGPRAVRCAGPALAEEVQ